MRLPPRLRKGEVPHLNQYFRSAGFVWWVHSVTLRNRTDGVTTPDMHLAAWPERVWKAHVPQELER